MGIARNIARLVPNGSGLLPNANIEAVAASKLTGQVPDANAPSGSVIQVVQAVKGDTQTIQSSSWIDVSGLSASITPQSTSNRILVMATLSYSYTESWNSGSMRLYRSSTPIFIGDAATSRTQVTTTLATQTVEPQNELMFTRTVQFVDSPNTTSALTYKVAVSDFDDGGGPIYINRCRNDSTSVGRAASSIIVMEISS